MCGLINMWLGICLLLLAVTAKGLSVCLLYSDPHSQDDDADYVIQEQEVEETQE